MRRRGAGRRFPGMLPLIGLFCLPLVLALGAEAAAGALEEGAAFPDFAAVDMEGNSIDTRTFKDKVLLLDFWSIYCSSCIQEMPHIVDLYNRYSDRGLVVLGIDLDVYGAKRVVKFIKGLDFSIPYPNIIDTKMEIKKLLGVSMLPTTIVVDSQRVVRLFHVGYRPGFEEHLEDVIKKHLPVQ